MRRFALMISLLIIGLFLLVGCNPEEEIQYIPTIVYMETRQAETSNLLSTQESLSQQLTSENEGINTSLSDTAMTLSTKEAALSDAIEQFDILKENNDGLSDQVSGYMDLFTAKTGDKTGEYVFCTYALETVFAYVDKVSMRSELAKYVAGFNNINIDSIQTQHQMIWSNTDDGLIKVFGGGYMYPFIVRFENTDFGSENSVYSLTSGCYVDFPKMEKIYLGLQEK